MDYEKKYKEALERARNLYNEINNTCLVQHQIKGEAALQIFPELKKSEDEKIREELIRYLPYCDDISKDTKERWNAWLENQSETFTKKDVDDAYLKGICDAKRELERQGEQKPASYFYCKYGGTIPKCSDCKRNHLNCKYEIKEITTWMTPTSRGTKQCSDYIQQNPAWSEEDEKIFRALSNALARISSNTRTDSTSVNYSFYREIEWLKSLKDRYTWKPNIEQLTAFAVHLNKRGAFRDDLCMDFEHEAQSFIEMQNPKEL